LIEAAEAAARNAGCRSLEIETQDINVPACRLYARCGYVLSAVTTDAYPEAPNEARLLWRKPIRSVP
jgi:GNAT superfamily N-acetyltransferase